MYSFPSLEPVHCSCLVLLYSFKISEHSMREEDRCFYFIIDDMSPSSLDSSLCFIQPGISQNSWNNSRIKWQKVTSTLQVESSFHCVIYEYCVTLALNKPGLMSSLYPPSLHPFLFPVALSLQKSCRDVLSSPYAFWVSPMSYVSNILPYQGTFVATKKLTLVYYY